MVKNSEMVAISSSIRQDVEDTLSKISKLKSWLEIMDSFILECQLSNNRDVTQQQAVDLVHKYQDLTIMDADDSTIGLTFLLNPAINFKRSCSFSTAGIGQIGAYYGFIFTTAEASTQYDFNYWWNYTTGKVEFTIEENGVALDNEDIANFSFDKITVGQYSMCSFISTIKESIQMNNFLLDVVKTLKSPASFSIALNKWINAQGLSTNLKNAISTAIGRFDGTSVSILSWLQDLYQALTDTSVQDDEITFSSTDYTVKYTFATVASVLISGIGTAVALVVTAISKVAGIIIFGLLQIGSAFVNAIKDKANPLITVKNNVNGYDWFLPIPVMQETLPSLTSDWTIVNIDYVNNKVEERSANLRIESLLSSFRVFKNKGDTALTNYEAFIKTCIHPNDICTVMKNMVDNNYYFGWVSFEGQDLLNLELNEEKNGFYILDMPKEKNQALYLLAHLILFYGSFANTSGSISSDSGLTCYNAIKNDTATAAQVRKFIVVMEQWYADLISSDNVFNAFYTDFGASLLSYDINWAFVINHFIPIVRSSCKVSNVVNAISGISNIRNQDFIGANDALAVPPEYPHGPYRDNYTMYIDEPMQQYDSPFVIPKYTSAGFIRNLVLSAVIIAATVAVAAATVVAYKRITTRIAINKTAKLTELKQFNDAVQNDSSYSKADKKLAYNDYYKAVKSYNRTSWLWGGGTWSATNGWVDYTSTPSSNSGLAETIKSNLGDQTLLLGADNNDLAVDYIIENDDTNSTINDVYHSIVG